jgi:hypothetical protein
MTNLFTPTWLDRFTETDPVREFLIAGLTEPASSATRSTMMINHRGAPARHAGRREDIREGSVRDVRPNRPDLECAPPRAEAALNRASAPVPPVLLVDAEKLNPYRLLVDLHDHALGRSSSSHREEVLAELALAAAVVEWWSRWQPLTIHAAFLAGAGSAEVAAATGLDREEAVSRWREWAEAQTRLIIAGRPGVDVDEIRTINERLRREVDVWT